jgi:hypothetical protein
MNTNCRTRVCWVLSLAMVAVLTSTRVFATPPTCSVEAQIAPANQNVAAGTVVNGVFSPTVVKLNGQPSKNADNYSWVQTGGSSTVTLSDSTAAQPTFTAPNVPPHGTSLTFQLTVTGCSPVQTASATTTVNVSYVEVNRPPVAAATVSPNPADEGVTVTLDGSPSTDPDGDLLAYSWTQVGGSPSVSISGSSSALATFVAPNVPYPVGASLTFRLTVSDGYLTSSVDKIVNVTWVNAPPVASVNCPASVNEYNKQVTLDGSGSTDDDGDGIASYDWSQTLGPPSAELPNPASSSAISFDAPQLTSCPSDTMHFKLLVTDAGGLQDSKECTVQVKDVTPPTITAAATTPPNGNDWYKSDVTVHFTCWDAFCIADNACPVDQVLSNEGNAVSSTAETVQDEAGNTSDPSNVVTVAIDKTKPTATASPSPAANGNGWNNTDVKVSFSGSDSLSGIDYCTDPVTLSNEGAGQSVSGTCTDEAGNQSAQATASGINIDRTAPSVAWDGGPDNGGTYYFGSVPAAPTCTANDVLSGPNSCTVTGYSTVVGTHTLTAKAIDKAGNPKEETRSYTVNAWTLKGFYQPVDMGSVLNTVKGGSTVPLKFNINAGSTEIKDVSAVKSFAASSVSCGAANEEAAVELTTTGGTSLRYDATAGQFIQNWQTPKPPGVCYRVTMTTQDGSSLVALFKTK